MAAIRKVKKAYQVDFILFGHRIRTNFVHPGQAEEFKDRLLQTFPSRHVTIDRAIKTYLMNETDKRKSQRSRIMERYWFYELKLFLKTEYKITIETLISEVSRYHLEGFQSHLQRYGSGRGVKLTASSVNRRFHSIKNLFRKLHEWKFIRENPAENIRKVPEKISRRPPWSASEIEIVLSDRRLQSIDMEVIHLLMFTGIRLGSALDIKCGDVDLVNKTIVVRQRKGQGGESSYVIPLAPQLFEIFKTKMSQRRDDFLFRDDQNRRLSTSLVSKRFSRFSVLIGRPHLTLHGLRHTFASRIHMAGASTETVRQLLGHRSVRTTQNYLHTDFEHLRKWIG